LSPEGPGARAEENGHEAKGLGASGQLSMPPQHDVGVIVAVGVCDLHVQVADSVGVRGDQVEAVAEGSRAVTKEHLSEPSDASRRQHQVGVFVSVEVPEGEGPQAKLARGGARHLAPKASPPVTVKDDELFSSNGDNIQKPVAVDVSQLYCSIVRT